MNTHASAFLLGRFPPQCCGCLLPCAKVPALDVVLTSFQTSFHRSSRPDIVWGLPTCLHVLLLDSVTLPILAKIGSERGNSRQSKKTSGPDSQVPEPLCSHTCRICRGPRRDTMAVWQQDHVQDVVDQQLCYSCIKHGSKNESERGKEND